MRLTCPTCAARYEVADGMIAPRGQHVQCTACHTRWFERPPDRAAAALLGEDEIIARLEARGGRGPRPVESAGGAQGQTGQEFLWEGRAAAADETRRAGAHLRLVGDAPSESADMPGAAPDVGGEAAPDVGPETKLVPKAEAELRPSAPSRLTEPEPEPEAEPGSKSGLESALMSVDSSRGRRLDLDRAPGELGESSEDVAAGRRRWPGLLAAGMVLLALLAAAYLAAEDIAEAVPSLKGPLGDYVGAVDGARSTVGLGPGL